MSIYKVKPNGDLWTVGKYTFLGFEIKSNWVSQQAAELECDALNAPFVPETDIGETVRLKATLEKIKVWAEGVECEVVLDMIREGEK